MDIDALVSSSFTDFHAKGLEYLCVTRSEALTRKVYFFGGDASQSAEVVAPHDHRYDFRTTVLAGHLSNWRYQPDGDGEPYEQFEYRTPLNGGGGFQWKAPVRLHRGRLEQYEVGDTHRHRAHELHTIRAGRGAVIELVQFEDVVPLGEPTSTFLPKGRNDPPSLDGLYKPMSADRWMKLYTVYLELLWGLP